MKGTHDMSRWNFRLLISLLFVFYLINTALALADKADTTKITEPTKHQTNCPVMGGKIDSAAYSNIQGQRVYHCCNGCQKKLAADPDKYFKQAAKDGILFENIQKRCPVSGKAIEKKEVFTDFEGRRIYFADRECAGKFAAEPAKYVKALDLQTKEDYPAKTDEKGGH